MCVNCLSTVEQQVGCAVLAIALVREPAHRLMAAAGWVPEPDPAGRARRTVDFLRSMDLDPVEILGAATVIAADGWTYASSPAARFRSRKRSSAAPIGSHSLLSAT